MPVLHSARHATTVTSCHEYLTNSSRRVHVYFTPCPRIGAPPATVTCTSRSHGTSSSLQVYAFHEEFAHFTNTSRRVHEQITLPRDSGARVRAGCIYTASWTLLTIPQIAREETTCLKQRRHGEEQSREGQTPTSQMQRQLREIIPPSHPYQVSMSSRRHSRIAQVRTSRLPRSRKSGSGCPRKKSLTTAGQNRPRRGWQSW